MTQLRLRPLAGYLAPLAALLVSCSSPSPPSGVENDAGSGPSPCDACADSAALEASDGSADAGPDATLSDAAATEASSESGGDSPSEADILASEASLEGGDANDAQGAAVASLCSSGCPAGETLCQGMCVSKSDPAYGCGGPSCQACALAHAASGCGAGGGCAIAACEPGWADCDTIPGNGCEADLSNPATCTACNVQCAAPTGLCAPTGCVAACAAGLTLCATADAGAASAADAGPGSGSCADLTSSPKNCGICGKSCAVASTTTNGSGVCAAGSCAGTSCYPGYTNCNGACLDTTRDPTACGTCAMSCPAAANGFATCSASQCGRACEPGWTLCNTACAATQTDPSNCGACGSACPSNEICAAGACQPLQSIWLATGVPSVQEMAVDATGVYWTDWEGHVMRVPLAGGAVVTLAQGQAKPWGIALDGNYVYWSNNLGGAILRAPKDGSGSPTVVTAATSPMDIGIYGPNVYWIDQGPNVWMSAKDGGGAANAAADGGGTADAAGASEGGSARDAGDAGGTPDGGGAPAIARVIAAGNAALVANQNGVFVENRSAAKAGVYGVTGGWFAPSMSSAAGLLDDGSHLFIEEDLDAQHCQIDAVAETGGALGAVFSAPCPVTPLAAGGCGVFYVGAAQPNLGATQLNLVRTGGISAAPVMKLPVQHAAIYGTDLYFYTSLQAIGRVPLP